MEKRQNYVNTIGTWREQRQWGFDAPFEALRDHPLHQRIENELNAMIVMK